MKRDGGRDDNDPNVTRMLRAKKWMNLSTRKFEKIFGRIDDTQNEMAQSFKGLGVLQRKTNTNTNPGH